MIGAFPTLVQSDVSFHDFGAECHRPDRDSYTRFVARITNGNIWKRLTVGLYENNVRVKPVLCKYINMNLPIVLKYLSKWVIVYNIRTGCPKSHAPSLTRYIIRYENRIVIKEVCSDRVTFHNFCETKHDHIDDILNEFA